MTTTCMKKLKAYLDVRNQLLNFLREDVGSGDITSESIISSNTSALAHIICKSKKKKQSFLASTSAESYLERFVSAIPKF